MVRRSFTLALILSLLLAATPAPAQVRKRAAARTSAPILERNIRAELSFLASDAMQVRGSGSN
jgi:hypothetical protein